MKEKSLKQGVFFNSLKSFMGLLFPLLSFPYASRILLPEGIGKINFVNSIIDYFLMLSMLGINMYATREAAKLRDNREKLSRFSQEIFSINLISTILSLVILCVPLFFSTTLAQYKTLIIISAAKIPFALIGFEWLYTAEEDFAFITIRSFIFQLLSLILLFLCVKTSEHYIRYAFIGVLSNVGSNICNFMYVKKFITLQKITTLSNMKKHLRPIFIFFGASCAAKIQTMLDSVMLGIISGNIAVGYYSASVKIVRIVNTLISTATTTLLPRSSYYFEKNEIEKYRQLLKKALNISIFFSFPAVAGLVILRTPLVLVFSGNQYLPAATAMCIISPTIFFAAIGTLIDSMVFIPQKKERLTFYFQIVNCIVNIILNLFLIPKYGAFGAALATTIAELLNMTLKLVVAWKALISISVIKECFKTLICTILMLLCILFITKKIVQPLPNLLISITIGIMVFMISAIICKHEISVYLLEFIKRKIKTKG